MDHRTGYTRAHEVDGRGPFAGSELMWEAALAAARRSPGVLTAAAMRSISAAEVARIFAVDEETVGDPERRAALWHDLGAGVGERYGGSALVLLESARGRLAGPEGLLTRLAVFEAYGDPLAKKAFLLAKICERRGWLEVADPDSWEVCADNVLMRLALRSGLVQPGPLDAVRAATSASRSEIRRRPGTDPAPESFPRKESCTARGNAVDQDHMQGRMSKTLRLAAIAVLALAALAPVRALAGGGVPPVNPPPRPPNHGAKAKLVDGQAVAPASAPGRVKDVIAAANKIAKGHPYCLGGGHQSWRSRCYDCSGAVSFALHAGDYLHYPEVSGDLAKWGARGVGKWITVYANKNHVFMMVAGRRFDTADTLGNGPGWAADMGAWESSQHYKARNPG